MGLGWGEFPRGATGGLNGGGTGSDPKQRRAIHLAVSAFYHVNASKQSTECTRYELACAMTWDKYPVGKGDVFGDFKSSMLPARLHPACVRIRFDQASQMSYETSALSEP